MMEDKPVEYETRTIKILVGVKGEPLYNEMGYMIEVTDEGGGEFVEVSPTTEPGKLRIDKRCWPTLHDAIDKMLKECREDA